MKRSVQILWRIFFIGLGLVILIFAAANFGLFGKMPSVQELENPEADLASEIISADGILMGKYYSENRSEVKYNEISPNAVHALIATEDERFFDHSGIDAKALARVIFTAGSQGGGSTLTQQLAKMMLGQGKGNVLVRGIQKLKEWIVQIDEFIRYLNGTDPSSMQVQLHSAACDSIFEDIARSEKKKISRLAAELSSLSESLKGYLISANDK